MANSIRYRKMTGTDEGSLCYTTTPFIQPLHYHEEYELMYVTSGGGKEYIGNSAADYKKGDLTLIGAGVPHLHLNTSVNGGKEKGSCEILYFSPSVFPANMAEIKEYGTVTALLRESLCGIRFLSDTTIKKAYKIMRKIKGETGIERIVSLYRILDILGKCTEKRMISAPFYDNPLLKDKTDEPVNRVYNYLLKNFKRTVTLEEVAKYANRNPAALCRAFRLQTDRTVFECLNRIRIEYACGFLAGTKLTVSQIAYESGFNHPAYFNRAFKKTMRQSPTEYRNNINNKML